MKDQIEPLKKRCWCCFQGKRVIVQRDAMEGARDLLGHFYWAKPEEREFCIYGAYDILDHALKQGTNETER